MEKLFIGEVAASLALFPNYKWRVYSNIDGVIRHSRVQMHMDNKERSIIN